MNLKTLKNTKNKKKRICRILKPISECFVVPIWWLRFCNHGNENVGWLTGNFQRSRALVSGDLDGDSRRVVDLAVLDDQLPLLPLCHDLDPTYGCFQGDLTIILTCIQWRRIKGRHTDAFRWLEGWNWKGSKLCLVARQLKRDNAQ